MCLVEGYYLKRYAGGFTENFYGIKRERLVPGDKAGNGLKRVGTGKFRALRNREVLGSLLLGVGGEYLERKAETLYEAMTVGDGILSRRNRDERPDRDAPLKEKVVYWAKFLFKLGYPHVTFVLYMQKLAFSMLYLFGNTAYPSLQYYLLNIRPRRITMADMPAPKPGTKRDIPLGEIISNPVLLARTAVPLALSSLKIILPTGIFFLKFLEWWSASDFARQLSSASQKNIELPPPARLPPTSKEEELKEKNKEAAPGACAVCGEDMDNPTVIQTGAVCCYRCAFSAAEEGVCAVTGRKVVGGDGWA